MYDLFLPAEVRELLQLIKFTISLGIDGIPLACVGANGYLWRLVFWMAVPLASAIVAMCVSVARVLLCSSDRTNARLLKSIVPVVLRIFFLSYPIVTNVAFEAFSCFEFEDGNKSFLIAE